MYDRCNENKYNFFFFESNFIDKGFYLLYNAIVCDNYLRFDYSVSSKIGVNIFSHP